MYSLAYGYVLDAIDSLVADVRRLDKPELDFLRALLVATEAYREAKRA